MRCRSLTYSCTCLPCGGQSGSLGQTIIRVSAGNGHFRRQAARARRRFLPFASPWPGWPKSKGTGMAKTTRDIKTACKPPKVTTSKAKAERPELFVWQLALLACGCKPTPERRVLLLDERKQVSEPKAKSPAGRALGALEEAIAKGELNATGESIDALLLDYHKAVEWAEQYARTNGSFQFKLKAAKLKPPSSDGGPDWEHWCSPKTHWRLWEFAALLHLKEPDPKTEARIREHEEKGCSLSEGWAKGQVYAMVVRAASSLNFRTDGTEMHSLILDRQAAIEWALEQERFDCPPELKVVLAQDIPPSQAVPGKMATDAATPQDAVGEQGEPKAEPPQDVGGEDGEGGGGDGDITTIGRMGALACGELGEPLSTCRGWIKGGIDGDKIPGPPWNKHKQGKVLRYLKEVKVPAKPNYYTKGRRQGTK